MGKVDSGGTKAFRRDGAGVTAPVLSDGAAVYTPGVSQRRSGSTTFDLSDRLGSAVKQTNASASTTATRSYDAFGTLVASSGTPRGPFGFAGSSGYQEDGDSGLKLLGHRYYDPSTGRFLTRDTAKDGRNWYAYCANSPLRNLDASGLSFWGWGDDRWTEFSEWFSGRDTTDKNGNPVRIGGWPAIGNKGGNFMTVDGTIHANDEEDYEWYNSDDPNAGRRRDHEEGHIYGAPVNKSDLLPYAVLWPYAIVVEILDRNFVDTNKPPSGEPIGHDYIPYEMWADSYADQKEGK